MSEGNNTNNAEDILRKFPLYNAHGSQFPRNVLPRLQVPQIKLQALQPSSQIFDPWYQECDNLITACRVHDEGGEQFDQWYSQRYMSNKPPGMIENVMLSPSRRD